MNAKIKNVLRGYLNLNSQEKNIVREELKKLGNNAILEDRSYSDVLNKSLGPLSQGICSCCGK